MLNLQYSIVIEATEDPDYFAFYSPTLEGFTGIGHSVEVCLYRVRFGEAEHVSVLKTQGLPIPPPDVNPTVLIRNEAPPLTADW